MGSRGGRNPKEVMRGTWGEGLLKVYLEECEVVRSRGRWVRVGILGVDG